MLAQEAAFQLGLEQVLLVPTGEAPHKRIDPEPGARVRLELARLAAQGDELLEVSDIEVVRAGPSYSSHTLERLSDVHAGDNLYFLMGADVAAQLEAWHEPARVLELARLAIAARPGTMLDEAEAALKRLDAGERAEFIEMPEIGVSSSVVRRRVAQGQPVSYLVPEAVAAMIAERGLYREAVAA